PFDSGRHSGRELPAQGQAPRRLAEGTGSRTEHASTGMTRSLPRWVRNPRAPLRQTRGGRCAARGSPLCTTWTSRDDCAVGGPWGSGRVEFFYSIKKGRDSRSSRPRDRTISDLLLSDI